jgi:CRISPR/Cas system-associated exonuclease Cas4 (RecB family)
MIDLCTPVVEFHARSLMRTPCNSNRASNLGYAVPELDGCLKRGVYERVAWDQKELPSKETGLIFEEGHRQERAVLIDLLNVGIEVIEQQTMYEWKEHQITGHLDGKIIEDGVAIPLEIKSCHPNIWDSISDFESLKSKPWLRAYMAQITLYMLMQGVDRGIFLFKNKSTGMLKQLIVTLDYDLGEACIRAAETINKHVKAGTFPEGTDNRETCKKCPFRMLCLPDISFGAPLKIVEDPMFEDRFTRCIKLKEKKDEYDSEWEIVKGEMKSSVVDGELNIMVGKWHVTGKLDKKGALRTTIEDV